MKKRAFCNECGYVIVEYEGGVKARPNYRNMALACCDRLAGA